MQEMTELTTALNIIKYSNVIQKWVKTEQKTSIEIGFNVPEG